MHGDWLHRRALLSPNATALINTLHPDGHEVITYRKWNRRANQTAHFLAGLGVQKGDRVAVLAKNSTAYLDIWFALGKLGAILQNLNWRLTPTELQLLIEDATPTVLLYGSEFQSVVSVLRSPDSSIHSVVCLDDSGDTPFSRRETLPDSFTATPVEADDPWVICYTGGTTGTPKGAILTHGNIFWNSVNTVMSWGLTSGDVTILNAPLFHTGGLNVFTAPLVHIGGTSILCREFSADEFYALLQKYAVTVYFAVPTVFIALQQHPEWERTRFDPLKLLISGGAPCPLPVFEKFWAKGVDFKTGYGLTEAGPNTFWLPTEWVRAKAGAVGYPLFHIEVKVVDRTGTECAAGEMGELLIRGPHVCTGYWNNPAATAAAIRNGWLHTGDLAVQDSDGVYSIVGRSKEMIISGGENIYPAEIESVLAAHPAIAEVAVIGVRDEKWGEVGCACIVPRGLAPTEDDLLTFAATRLARYKLPRRIVIVTELPKTGAGKVDKTLLQERYGS